jgi:hypothetical protein
MPGARKRFLMVGVEEDEGGDEKKAEEDDEKGPPGVDPRLRFVRCAHYSFLLFLSQS